MMIKINKKVADKNAGDGEIKEEKAHCLYGKVGWH